MYSRSLMLTGVPSCSFPRGTHVTSGANSCKIRSARDERKRVSSSSSHSIRALGLAALHHGRSHGRSGPRADPDSTRFCRGGGSPSGQYLRRERCRDYSPTDGSRTVRTEESASSVSRKSPPR
jgi:hypothetical protein